jgi:hypothetical protein
MRLRKRSWTHGLVEEKFLHNPFRPSSWTAKNWVVTAFRNHGFAGLQYGGRRLRPGPSVVNSRPKRPGLGGPAFCSGQRSLTADAAGRSSLPTSRPLTTGRSLCSMPTPDPLVVHCPPITHWSFILFFTSEPLVPSSLPAGRPWCSNVHHTGPAGSSLCSLHREGTTIPALMVARFFPCPTEAIQIPIWWSFHQQDYGALVERCLAPSRTATASPMSTTGWTDGWGPCFCILQTEHVH